MKYLVILVCLKLFVMLYLINLGGIALGPDEAQYWTWSHSLDFGYYSKPPGIAWMIALGTVFWGSTELGVRLYALILGSLLPFVVYYLAICAGQNKKVALYSGVLMALTPLGFLSTLFATTDVGFVFFWVLATAVWARAMEKKEAINAYAFAILVACGALFKWPIYILWALALIFYWRQWSVFLLALLGLLPSLYWNISHDFATFKHVGATIDGGSSKGNLLEFIGAQAALVSPLIFLFFIYASFFWFKKRREMGRGMTLCAYLTFLPLGAYLIASCFQKIQGNWCVFVYPTAFVLVASVFEKRSKWLQVGIVLSALLTIFILMLPTGIANGWLPQKMNKMNPFKECVGWRELAPLIEKIEERKSWFLFSHTYQMASELSFYNKEKKRAYFFNIEGRRRNQFSYWPQMEEEEKGKNGLFFTLDKGKNWEKELTSYFEQVELDGEYSLFSAHGEALKVVKVYRCYHYNGKMPSSQDLY